MKKWLLLGLIFSCSYSYASDVRNGTTRVWKSSWTGSGDMNPTMLSSATIVFHMAVGSFSVNNGGDSFLAIYESPKEIFDSAASTVAYIPLDSYPPSWPGVGQAWDVSATSHTFVIKKGNAPVMYLWDYYIKPGYATPYDNR